MMKFLLLLPIFISLSVRAMSQQNAGPGQTDTLTIHFSYNQSRITEKDGALIDSFLDTRPRPFTPKKIKLSGYCDASGSDTYNDSLSFARAIATKNYLLARQIPSAAFAAVKGYGKRMPLNKNQDEPARSLNRRVQICFYENPVPNSLTPSSPYPNSSPSGKSVPHPSPASLASPDQPGTPTQANTLQEKRPTDLLSKIKDSAVVGTKIILRTLNFPSGRHNAYPESFLILNELREAMDSLPTLRIEISGYVCCCKDDQDGIDLATNKEELSIQRARYVYDYLIRRGINPSRLRYQGLGGRDKLYPEEKTEEERSLNRRVEIRIVSR